MDRKFNKIIRLSAEISMVLCLREWSNQIMPSIPKPQPTQIGQISY